MPETPRPDSKQLRILKKLCAHLELTSGYDGIICHRGLSVISADNLMDTLSLLEAPRPVVGSAAGVGGPKRAEEWTLLLQGWPRDDKKNPSDPAYAMKAACEHQLSKLLQVNDDNTGVLNRDGAVLLGGDISSLTIGQGVVRPPNQEAASRLAMFYLPLILEITTDVRNPWA